MSTYHIEPDYRVALYGEEHHDYQFLMGEREFSDSLDLRCPRVTSSEIEVSYVDGPIDAIGATVTYGSGELIAEMVKGGTQERDMDLPPYRFPDWGAVEWLFRLFIQCRVEGGAVVKVNLYWTSITIANKRFIHPWAAAIASVNNDSNVFRALPI